MVDVVQHERFQVRDAVPVRMSEPIIHVLFIHAPSHN